MAGQGSRRAHLVQVGLHQLKHNVDVFKRRWRRRQHDVPDLHNVCARATDTQQRQVRMSRLHAPVRTHACARGASTHTCKARRQPCGRARTGVFQQPQQLDLAKNPSRV
eukprot:360262-Chlamydomonas_euryale.AAC.10